MWLVNTIPSSSNNTLCTSQNGACCIPKNKSKKIFNIFEKKNNNICIQSIKEYCDNLGGKFLGIRRCNLIDCN